MRVEALRCDIRDCPSVVALQDPEVNNWPRCLRFDFCPEHREKVEHLLSGIVNVRLTAGML